MVRRGHDAKAGSMKPTTRWLTPDLWPALEDLFAGKGACGGCWCMYWRIGRAYRNRPRNQNKAASREVVKGAPPGFACVRRGRRQFHDVSNFAQTPLIQSGYGNPTIRRKLGGNMLTSAECRANAEQKLTEAEPDCDKRQKMRLIEAAQAWLILASQIRRIEASYAAAPQSSRAAALSPLFQSAALRFR